MSFYRISINNDFTVVEVLELKFIGWGVRERLKKRRIREIMKTRLLGSWSYSGYLKPNERKQTLTGDKRGILNCFPIVTIIVIMKEH